MGRGREGERVSVWQDDSGVKNEDAMQDFVRNTKKSARTPHSVPCPPVGPSHQDGVHTARRLPPAPAALTPCQGPGERVRLETAVIGPRAQAHGAGGGGVGACVAGGGRVRG
jgi:hypothetical protein